MKLIIFLHNCGDFTYVHLLSEPEKRNKCPAEMAETVLSRRKKWILENQGPEGEFYMNGSKAGDVNPYFACMAALGLLAETKNCPITETEKKAVGRYLDWHTGDFAGNRWKNGNLQERESGKLIYKEKADSEDGILVCIFLWENIWKRQKVQTCRKTGERESALH